jgi:hypothetical protein
MYPSTLSLPVDVDLQGVLIPIHIAHAILAQAVLHAGRRTMVVPAIQSDPLLLPLIPPCTLHQRLEPEMTPDARIRGVDIPLRGHLEGLHRTRSFAGMLERLLPPITTIAVTVPAASSFNLLMPLLPIRDFKGWEDDGIPGAVSAQCAPSDTAFLPLT